MLPDELTSLLDKLTAIVLKQDARIMWLEDLVRALIGTPNIHDRNYWKVTKLLERWPYNPEAKEAPDA